MTTITPAENQATLAFVRASYRLCRIAGAEKFAVRAKALALILALRSSQSELPSEDDFIEWMLEDFPAVSQPPAAC